MPYELFLKQISNNLYGVDCAEELKTIIDEFDAIALGNNTDSVKQVLEAIKTISNKAIKGNDHIALLKLGVEANSAFIEVEASLKNAESFIYRSLIDKLPTKGLGNKEWLIESLEVDCTNKIDEIEKRLRSTLSKYFRERDLEEYITSRLHQYRFRAENIVNFLASPLKFKGVSLK